MKKIKRNKILLIMKLTTFLLSIFLVSTSANTFSQKFSFEVKDETVKDVLSKIEASSDYKFLYRSDAIDVSREITLAFNDENIDSVLGKIFDQDETTYKIFVDNLIVLANNPLQQQTVTGMVSDAITGDALAGVYVVIEGTQTGTTTDVNGKYVITQPEKGQNLVFSFIGYLPGKIPYTGQNIIDMKLSTDIKALEEVVVVGYGTQKKSDVTGSIVRVTTEETSDLPNYNILQSIQGKVPGLNVTSSDRPGEDLTLTIRGINSISASSSPLIVVDGVIYNGSLSEFNTNDIATVDILKDASAAAVYGSRAANGVLLITTKTGTTGKPQFNFTTYQGIQKPDRLIDVLDGEGYLRKVLDFRQAKGLEADPANIDNYITVTEAENHQNGLTTDWMDLVTRIGTTSNYHLDVSSKTNSTNYYVSGTYFNQKGIVINDDFEMMSMNANLTNNITDWYAISIKSMFSSRDFSGREANYNGASQQSPYGNVYDENGPGGYAFLPIGDAIGVNPFCPTLTQNKDIRTSLWGLFSSILDVPFIPGLKWTINLSSNLRNSNLNNFYDNRSSNDGIVNNGVGTKEKTQNFDWTIDNIINYRNVFNKVHSIDLTLLYSYENTSYEYSGMTGKNFFTQVTGYDNLSLAQFQQIASNFEDQKSVSMMGRLNYIFNNKYAITLTARRDGFSGFAVNNKYATFPSIAIAWTASNEKFLQDISWLNYLKLRLSYGKNGNQAVGRYQSLARMNSNQYVFDQTSITTIFVNSMANNDLTWESTTSRNLGTDFGVFQNRLTGNIDIYSSDTKNLLLQRALPQTSGFNSIFMNIGEVHNNGFELALNSVNLRNDGSGLIWSSGFVFSLNRNKIVKLTGADANKDGIEDDDIINNWFIGESINSIFGYEVDGIYQLNEANIPAGFAPGDFRLVDSNKDGALTPEDRVIRGNTLPNYSFSISNNLQYKNFNFYMLINSIQGGRNNSYLGDNTATRSVSTGSATFTERYNFQDVPYWTPTRPSNEYSRIDAYPSLPTRILEDRSFIRLQDISISYTFNKGFFNENTNLKVYATAKNLYTITKWTGYDPENATVIRGGFPLMKSFTIGFDFKF